MRRSFGYKRDLVFFSLCRVLPQQHSPFNWVWSQNKQTPKSINPHSIFYGGKSRNWFVVFAIAWNVTTLIAAQEKCRDNYSNIPAAVTQEKASEKSLQCRYYLKIESFLGDALNKFPKNNTRELQFAVSWQAIK